LQFGQAEKDFRVTPKPEVPMRRVVLLFAVMLFGFQCAGSKKADQEADAERAKQQVKEAFDELKEESQK